MVEILLPTARWDPWVRGLLRHLDWMSREFEIRAAISDNSQNPEKQQFIEQMAAGNPRFRYILQTDRIGSLANLDALLRTTPCDYAVLLGDDDWIFPDYVLGADRFLEANPDSSAVMGCLLHLAPGIQASLHPPINITGVEPAARIRAYLAENDGFNHPVLSVFRTAAIEPFRAFCRNHPFIVSFFDYFQTFSYLAAGNLVSRNAQGPYLYVNANWSTRTRAQQSNTQSYAAHGLPAWFAEFHMLYRAVEGFNFFVGPFSPFQDERARQVCGLVVLEHYMQLFHTQVASAPAAWWTSLQALGIDAHVRPFQSESQMKISDVMIHFLAILNRASAELCRRYVQFHQQARRA